MLPGIQNRTTEANQDLSATYEWRFVWILAMLPSLSMLGSILT